MPLFGEKGTFLGLQGEEVTFGLVDPSPKTTQKTDRPTTAASAATSAPPRPVRFFLRQEALVSFRRAGDKKKVAALKVAGAPGKVGGGKGQGGMGGASGSSSKRTREVDVFFFFRVEGSFS